MESPEAIGAEFLFVTLGALALCVFMWLLAHPPKPDERITREYL